MVNGSLYLPLPREVREAAPLFEGDVTPSPSKERGTNGVRLINNSPSLIKGKGIGG